jgi:replicative DNA helicase
MIKLPPHSVEAEQAMLGALLVAGDTAWDRIADMVSEADLYRDDHRRIFRTIRALHEAAKPVDVVTVDEALAASNETDQSGGLAYLAEMANAVPSAANIRSYAATIADKAKRRRLIAVGDEIAALGFGGQPTQVSIDQASGMLFDLSACSAGSSEPKHIAEVVGRTMQQIEERIGKGTVFGLPTGFCDLDAMTGGMHAGDLVIVAGRPSMGKTAFAINVAEQVALDGKSVLVFSLEMGDTQIAMRNLAAIGSANIQRVRSGDMTSDEWDGVTAAMGRLYTSKFWIDDAAGLGAAQMHARARRIKRQHGLDLIVIDYLQLMQAEGNNRNEQLGDITRRLKLMARDLNVPVVLLSQLSRKVEERGDKRPLMSDLRESGSIEQDADVILMVYRDEYYTPDSPWKGMAELGMVKNRMGETGVVRLVFQGEYSRFRSVSPQAVADAAQRAAESRPLRARKRGMDL